MSAYTIRELAERDHDAALTAWNAVAARSIGGRERTRAEWDWTYRDNPAGTRAFVAEHEGRIVGLYAAVLARTRLDGEERLFGRIVDSLVLPEHRAGLKRPGLFVGVGRAFFEHLPATDRAPVFYGWPADAEWRVGERFLGYAPIRHEIVLAREVEAGVVDLPVGVERIARFTSEVRDLDERAARAFGASTVRDERFLNWRTVDRAGVDYRRFAARDAAGRLLGVAIQRTCRFLGDEKSVIVDWLVPHEEEAAAVHLLEALVAQTRADGVLVLCGIVPTWSVWFEWFQARGFRAHPSLWTLGGRSFDAAHGLDWLRERWWVQPSDGDLA